MVLAGALAPLFVTNVVFADQVTEDFRRSAQSIPQRLIRLGYDQLGHLDLRRTLQRSTAIQVESTGNFHRPEPVLQNFATARSGARWDTSTAIAKISVNRNQWATSSADENSVVGLHEVLGVEGFNDRNYQLSTSLWLLSQPHANDLETSEKQRLVKHIEIAASSGGGSITGVGGGGDVVGVRTRIKVLKVTLNRILRSKDLRARDQAMPNLFGDLEISEEVRWGRAGDKEIQIEITPADASPYTEFLKACAGLQAGSQKFREGVFRFLQKNDPEKARYYGGVSGMLRECERVERSEENRPRGR